MLKKQEQSAIQTPFDTSMEVPNLAPGSTMLLTQLMDRESGVQDLLGTVGQFAVVVAKLISLANSAWSKPTSPVTTLEVACTRLGLDVVRTVAIALVVGRSFDVSVCPGFDSIRYWASSIVTSETAAILAPSFQVDASSARTAGLLHNIGLLWLADCLPNEMSAALRKTEEDALVPGGNVTGLSSHLERSCGISYQAASLRLLTQWQMPAILTAGLNAAINSSENESHERLGQLVRCAAHIASSVCAGKETLEWGDGVEVVSAFNSVFEQQQSKLSRTLDLASSLIRA